MNPYDVLEISPGASPEEIKAAYHQMAKLWHPDRFAGDAKPEAEQRFRRLTEAFAMLKDTARQEAPAGSSQVHADKAAPSTPPIQLETPAEADPHSKTVDDWYKEAAAAMDAKNYDQGLGLVQYAIRLDGGRAEFHALYGKLLDLTGGDKRVQVKALETALRLNPRDVESSILLAQTFQALGMQARATRLWSEVRAMAPGHAVFGAPARKANAKAKAAEEPPGMGEQFSNLVAEAKTVISRLFKRG